MVHEEGLGEAAGALPLGARHREAGAGQERDLARPASVPGAGAPASPAQAMPVKCTTPPLVLTTRPASAVTRPIHAVQPRPSRSGARIASDEARAPASRRG